MQLRSLGYSFTFASIAGLILGALYFQTLQDRPGIPTSAPNSEERAKAYPEGFDISRADTWSTSPSGLSDLLWEIHTQEGLIQIRFFPKQAPQSCARIAELIDNKFYDGLRFHRVLPGFVIQAGDPSGQGGGGSGKALTAEFNSVSHSEGTVGLARGADPNSADSQFYITLSPQPHLDGNYTVIGKVITGIEVAKRIKSTSIIQRSNLSLQTQPSEQTATANSF